MEKKTKKRFSGRKIGQITVRFYTEKYFRNLIKSYRNQIVFIIFRLVWNRKWTASVCVPNQSKNRKYNLISVWIYKIQRRFFLCVLCGVETNSGQTRKTIRETGVSRQNGVPNKCAPQTPQFYSVVMVRGVPAGTQLEPLGRSWGFRETPNSRTALQVCRFFPVRI